MERGELGRHWQIIIFRHFLICHVSDITLKAKGTEKVSLTEGSGRHQRTHESVFSFFEFKLNLYKPGRSKSVCHLKAYLNGWALFVGFLSFSQMVLVPGEHLLVPYGFRFSMQPPNIRQDTSAIWEKLIKPTYRAHLFDEVSTPLGTV